MRLWGQDVGRMLQEFRTPSCHLGTPETAERQKEMETQI